MSFASIFDGAAAIALAFFIVRGLFRGLTGEIVGLVGFLASLFCAWTFAQPAMEAVLSFAPEWDPALVSLGCSVAIFIAVSLAFAVVDKIVSFIVEAADLSLIDHALGGFAGALKAGCIVVFIYGLLRVFPILPTAWMADSYAMRGAAVAWPPVVRLLEGFGLLDVEALTDPESKAFPAYDLRTATPTTSEDEARR
ncbi:MAG: CvpA family protein [Synergistaceae bacterium]|nr:CvpA family protein [Synergistaceae bacterium]